MTTTHILVVEDDPDVGRLVAARLIDEGLRVTLECDGTRGLRLALGRAWDLVILDWALPGTSGMEICRRLAARAGGSPVILLTARAQEDDRIAGLDAGAVDYVTKPFGIGELMARVRAQLRQRREVDPGADEPLRLGDIELDPGSRIVRRCGTEIPLTTREFALLRLLMQHVPRVFTREQLLNGVWGAGFEGYAHTVNSHINRLRAKIEPDPTNPRYVVTVWGSGYRFAGASGS